MRETKFTVNAVVLVALIFSALALFFTVKLPYYAYSEGMNDFSPIEGTDMGVYYSNRKQNGIYRPTNIVSGIMLEGELLLAGDFIGDWGAAYEDGILYLNELSTTELGMTTVKLVRVDTDGFKEKTLMNDSVMRGRCASGELVVIRGYMMSATYPETNSLAKLYGFSSGNIAGSGNADVVYLDPATGEIVHTVTGVDAEADDFEELFINRTLDEVRK